MKNLSLIFISAFLTALFIYTLIVLTAGLFLTLGFNLPFNDMTFGIIGALSILTFSKLYTNFNI